MALARAKASSWTGVAAASWRWYEQMLEAFHLGTSSRQNSYISAMIRRLSAGGKMYVPRARYSLMRSFWVVPVSWLMSTPRSWATAMYMASSHIAVPLIVIEVFISSMGISSKSTCMSSTLLIGTPTLPTSGRAMGSSES